MQPLSEQTFVGFNKPETNFFRLPNEWTDITARVTSLAEMKLVEYVLKHTLKMKTPIEEDEPEKKDVQTDVKNLYIGVKKFNIKGKESLHRSEKDTLRKIHIRNSRSKMQRNGSNDKQGYQSFQAIGDLLKQKTDGEGREVQHLPESIEASIDDISAEFHDTSNRRSNRTHVLHMYQVLGKTEERFTSYLYEARSITKQQGSIKKKMPYFFRVLEDVTGIQQRAVDTFSDASLTPQNALQQKFLPNAGNLHTLSQIATS